MIASLFNQDPTPIAAFAIIAMFWLCVLIAYNETN